ncbi:MAG TPA: hypothetical protein VFP15_04340 [Gemmatimonadaceae bacterium]|nr:hypothetical protein [Gemmatimonadaceae bacterium]
MLLKAFALRLVVGRTIGGLLGTMLLVLAPVAGVLKLVGLPVLIVLGVMVIKIVVPIVLVVWFVRWMMGRRGRAEGRDVGATEL